MTLSHKLARRAVLGHVRLPLHTARRLPQRLRNLRLLLLA